MKSIIRYTFLLSTLSVLSGCALLPQSAKDYLFDDLGAEPLSKNISAYMRDCTDKEFSEGKFNLECGISSQDLAISKVLIESVEICTNHMKTIYGNDAAWNISSGTFATFTSGWAAISSGGQAKLLSALSAFSNGERSLVNETIYKNQVTASIGIKIGEMREEKGNAIRSKIGKDDYSVAQAEYDLLDFHNSCSFYAGLQKALKEGTDTTPALKLSQLEAKHQNIFNQITLLTLNKDSNKSVDPHIYEDLVSQLKRVTEQINTLQGVATEGANH